MALLINYLSNSYERQYPLHELVVSSLELCNAAAIDFYLPQLFQCLRTSTNHKVLRFFTRVAKKSRLLLHKILWMTQVESFADPNSKRKVPLPYDVDQLPEISKRLFDLITGKMNKAELAIFKDETEFFSKITEISGVLRPKEHTKAEKKAIIQKCLEKYQRELEVRDPGKTPIYLLVNPKCRVKRIVTDTGTPMQSAERCPIMVTFVVESYEGPDETRQVERQNSKVSSSNKMSLIRSKAEEFSNSNADLEEVNLELIDPKAFTEQKHAISFYVASRGAGRNFNANISAMIGPAKMQEADVRRSSEVRGFGGERTVSCIFKTKDDVRQDILSIQIIRLFQEIFKKSRLDLFVYPYAIIPSRTGEVTLY